MASKSKSPDVARVVNRQLTLLQAKLESIDTAIHDLDDTEEDIACILEGYRDQVTEIKAELTALESSLLNSDVPTDDPVMQNQAQVDKAAFDCQLRIKKHLHALITTPTKASETTATKLPKLEPPTFHGDILQLKNFWEQFCVSVHNRATIPKEEKLIYMQNAIKDKTAKSLIAGLQRPTTKLSSVSWKGTTNRPRQIHQTHVCRIVEAPPLKDGTGKEIHALHNLVIQHLRALKSLGHEPSQAFITSLLEMKLDSTTMFEWQRHSQD